MKIKTITFGLLSLWLGLLLVLPSAAQDEGDITLRRVARGLLNPRGVALLPDGRLLVAEAGTGFSSQDEEERTGKLSLFEDLNGDGDYDDSGEQLPILEHIASYNSLTRFRTGHDEVNGIADILLLEDGRILFTKDDPLAEYVRQRMEYRSDTGIFALSSNWADPETRPSVTRLVQRPATVNALTYDPVNDLFYMAESGLNVLTAFSLDGEILEVIPLPLMTYGQQPVPAGLAYDATTGDILVALLSGFVLDYYGTQIAFMPGDARVLRYNPATGELSEAVTGLTTAVDVTVDEQGNIYTVELTTVWSAELMPEHFDLFNPDAPPDAGGYARFTGRVTQFPADGSPPRILADGLDTPTNITYAEGRLYVSAGQGTPGRPIWGREGRSRISGELWVIEGF